MTVSSRDSWLTDRSDQVPPRKSAIGYPSQQAPHEYPAPQPVPAVAAGQVLHAEPAPRISRVRVGHGLIARQL